MVKVKEQLDAVFHKEMDRKHFLQFGGGILLGLLGITGFLRLLTGTTISHLPAGQQQDSPSSHRLRLITLRQ